MVVEKIFAVVKQIIAIITFILRKVGYGLKFKKDRE